MMFDEPLLGVGPKAFQAVDVHFAPSEAPIMIHPQVAIAAEHQGVIDLVAVGVDHAAPTDHLHGGGQKGLGRDVADRLHLDPAAPLQDAENRDFTRCASASLALALAPEVGLVRLHLPSKKLPSPRRCGHKTAPERRHGPQRRRIAHGELLGHLAGRDLQLKKLHHPKPLPGREAKPAQPAPRERPEGVPTLSAAKAPLRVQNVAFSALTTGADFMPVFLTRLEQMASRCNLRFYKAFKALQVHDTSLIRCQIFCNRHWNFSGFRLGFTYIARIKNQFWGWEDNP